MSKSYDEYSEEKLAESESLRFKHLETIVRREGQIVELEKRIKELEEILSDVASGNAAFKVIKERDDEISELKKDCIRPCPRGSETESAFMAGRMLACEVRAELKEWKVAAGAEAHEADKLRAINKGLKEENDILIAEIKGLDSVVVPRAELKEENAKLKADAERMKRLEIKLNDQLQKEGNEVFEANKEIVKLKAVMPYIHSALRELSVCKGSYPQMFKDAAVTSAIGELKQALFNLEKGE